MLYISLTVTYNVASLLGHFYGLNLNPSVKNFYSNCQDGEPEEGKSKKGQYEGPDADLAAMLERDVLDNSPGVRWDDVAGLSEAKRLLEEAVVLPLWMPEYFQVTQLDWEGAFCGVLFYLSLLFSHQ